METNKLLDVEGDCDRDDPILDYKKGTETYAKTQEQIKGALDTMRNNFDKLLDFNGKPLSNNNYIYMGSDSLYGSSVSLHQKIWWKRFRIGLGIASSNCVGTFVNSFHDYPEEIRTLTPPCTNNLQMSINMCLYLSGWI